MVSRSSVEKITCVCGGNYLKVVLAIKKAEGMDKSYLIIYLASRRCFFFCCCCCFSRATDNGKCPMVIFPHTLHILQALSELTPTSSRGLDTKEKSAIKRLSRIEAWSTKMLKFTQIN